MLGVVLFINRSVVLKKKLLVTAAIKVALGCFDVKTGSHLTQWETIAENYYRRCCREESLIFCKVHFGSTPFLVLFFAFGKT